MLSFAGKPQQARPAIPSQSIHSVGGVVAPSPVQPLWYVPLMAVVLPNKALVCCMVDQEEGLGVRPGQGKHRAGIQANPSPPPTPPPLGTELTLITRTHTKPHTDHVWIMYTHMFWHPNVDENKYVQEIKHIKDLMKETSSLKDYFNSIIKIWKLVKISALAGHFVQLTHLKIPITTITACIRWCYHGNRTSLYFLKLQ